MKKFLIISIFVLTNIFNVIASPVDRINLKEKDCVVSAYYSKDSIMIEQQFNFNSLYRYLNLDIEQINEFYEIHKNIYNTIDFLEEKKDKGKNGFNNKIKRELRDIHYILDDDQYHKYLRILNITLQNKNLTKYII